MPLGDPIANFLARLLALQRETESLSTALGEPLSNFAVGIPIDAQLQSQLRETCDRIVAFRQELKSFGAENLLTPDQVSLDSARFGDLGELLKGFESKAAGRFRAIASKLELIERLVVRKEGLGSTFQVVFDEAKRLRTLLPEGGTGALPPEILDFDFGKHRLSKLIRFLEIQRNPEEVSPDELDVVDAEVEEAFGRPFRVRAREFLHLPADQPAVEPTEREAISDEGRTGTQETSAEVPTGGGKNTPLEGALREAAPLLPVEPVGEIPLAAPITEQDTTEPPRDESPLVLEKGPVPESTDDVDNFAEQLVADAIAEMPPNPPPPNEPSILMKEGPKELLDPVFGKDSETFAKDAAILLAEIETANIPVDYRKAESLALQLLECERSGLAWVLWSGLRSPEVPFSEAVPCSLLRATAITRFSYRPDGETAEILSEDCSGLLEGWRHSGELPPHYYYWLLAVAAKPALFSGDAGARDILWRMANSQAASAALRDLARLLAEFASSEVPIDPMQVRSTLHIGTRDAALSNLKRQASLLLGRSARSDRTSGSAMKVWRHLTQPEGILRRLLQPTQDSRTDIDVVKDAIRSVRNTAAIIRHIEVGEERAAHGVGSIRRGSPNYEDLVRSIEEAREIAKQWTSLCAEPTSAMQAPAGLLRTDFENARRKVDAELAAMQEPIRHSVATRTACETCLKTLGMITKVLNGEVESWASHDAITRSVGSDLYLIPGQGPSAWRSDCSQEEALHVLRFMKRNSRWSDCAQELVAHDQFGSLRTIVQRLRESLPAGASFLEAYCEEWLLYRWRMLAWRFSKTDNLLNAAMGNSLVGVVEAQNYRAQLDKIKAGIPAEFLSGASPVVSDRAVPDSPFLFSVAENTIEKIEKVLTENRRHFISEAETAVILPEGASPRMRAAFNRLIDLGAFNKALILSELASHGSIRLLTHRATALEDFFPRVPDWGAGRQLDSQMREALNQLERLGVDVSGLSQEGREEAEQHLRNWFGIAKWIDALEGGSSQRATTWKPDLLRSVLEFIGFSIPPGSIPVPDVKTTHRLQVDVPYIPTEDRHLCPFSEFGSQSGGLLRVVLLRKITDPLELSSLLGPAPQRTVVLYFRSYSAEQRKILARACWDSSKTFLVLDSALFAYLSTRPAGRLRAFFECVLPFTYAQPYVSSGGSLPPEMFFGRETQKAGLLALGGPYLVYGGRQLGKTALLREVERLVNQRQPNQQAIWMDLQSRQLGINQPIDELWTQLFDELRARKIVAALSGGTNEMVDQQTVLAAIRQWLSEDTNRRLLLLLDEADTMLEQDNRPRLAAVGQTTRHVLTNGLAGLQTEFRNRFKVVFAGLRDVQHFAYDNSHPFGKLGKPLLIGPFAATAGGWSDQRKELEAARELILDPLRCLGFRFESESVLQSVLWATNFYPSLAQIVGENLIQQLTQVQPSGPPYELTDAAVRAVLHSPKVLAEFEHRLKLTLGLDGRFAAIVYVIAALIYTAPDQRSFEGFDRSVIEVEVRKTAGALFGAGSDGVDRVLQDMVEMGVLRRTGEHFDLRSPALLQMLGDYDAIYEQLTQERELEPIYDPGKNRSRVPKAPQIGEFEYNPLTDEEFQSLIAPRSAVSVCMGNAASGIDRIVSCLQAQFPNQQKRLFIFSDLDFFRWKEELLKAGDRPKGKTSIFVVTNSCAWSDRWILHADEKLRQYSNPVHFLFLADPRITLDLNGPTTPLGALRQKNVRTISLGPWADVVLRTWLHELGYDASPSERSRITSLIGNWPAVLERFHRYAKSTRKPWLDALVDFHQLCLASPQEYLSLFGFDALKADNITTLKYLCTGPASIKDLRTVDDSKSTEQSLAWATSLLLVDDLAGKYKLDPFVSELLARVD